MANASTTVDNGKTETAMWQERIGIVIMIAVVVWELYFISSHMTQGIIKPAFSVFAHLLGILSFAVGWTEFKQLTRSKILYVIHPLLGCLVLFFNHLFGELGTPTITYFWQITAITALPSVAVTLSLVSMIIFFPAYTCVTAFRLFFPKV